MAAEPLRRGSPSGAGRSGERTRFAHLEGVAAKGPRSVQHLLRPVYALSRWRHDHHLPHDLDNIERFVTIGIGPVGKRKSER